MYMSNVLDMDWGRWRERERYVHVYCNIVIATLYYCHFILRIQHLVHHMSSCTAPAIVWTIRIYLLYLFIWYGKVFDFICYLFKSPSAHPCTPPPTHQPSHQTINLKDLWSFPASWAKEEFPCHQAFGCFFGTSASHPLLCQQPQCEQQLFSGAYEGRRREGRWRDMAAWDVWLGKCLQPNRPKSRKSFHFVCNIVIVLRLPLTCRMQTVHQETYQSSCSAKSSVLSSVSTSILQGMVQDGRHTLTHIQGGWRDAWHPESRARHRVACLR